ncbi:MAG: winged helix-turn-helix domain-containing protein [Anaerolineae bacterium]|nr:winged helix-turn-helix domain-containing protein [Anaerolineae bacterium]
MALEQGFRIGTFDVFPLEGCILGPAGRQHIEPKAMQVLLELARHAGEVRSRRQIENVVWPRGFVSEDALTRCIRQLRRALGDDPKTPVHIETIATRGYRLRTAVHPLAATPRVPGRIESLIVLPFRQVSAEADAVVADGMTELLNLRLCGLQGVRILSRTTAMRFKGGTATLAGIAQQTGADWVVEGSVIQAGERLQVIAQLVEVSTDAHIWAGDYTGTLKDLIDVQNGIAERIAAAIQARLTDERQAGCSAPALEAPVLREYLRGRHLLSQRTVPALREAIAAFRVVTGAVPGFAPAWASRAECELLLMHYGAAEPGELLATCEAHLDRALSLDPDLGIGLSLRGALRFFFALDFDAAERDLRRALTLLPSYGLAMVQLASVSAVTHRFEEAHAWIGQALLVDPLDVGVNMNLGDQMMLQRRWAEAVHAFRRTLELAPGHRPTQLRLAWALAQEGQAGAARDALAACGPQGDSDAGWLEYAALVEAACGRVEAAAVHHDALVRIATGRRVPAWILARAAAAAGRRADALTALEKAAQERSTSLPFLRVTSAFDALHGDPRFEALAAPLPQPAGARSRDSGRLRRTGAGASAWSDTRSGRAAR